MDDKFFIPERPTAYEHRTTHAQEVPRLVDIERVAPPRWTERVSNGRMLGFAVAMVAIVGICAGGIHLLVNRREAALENRSDNGCKNETIALDIAQNAGAVMSVDKQAADIVVKVSWRQWIKTTRQAQIAIAKAAYCHVSPKDKGIVRVIDETGKELGRVVGGNWQSKLFGQ
jgi:hypothetical protein